MGISRRSRGHMISYPDKPRVPIACKDCAQIVGFAEPSARKVPVVLCRSCHEGNSAGANG